MYFAASMPANISTEANKAVYGHSPHRASQLYVGKVFITWEMLSKMYRRSHSAWISVTYDRRRLIELSVPCYTARAFAYIDETASIVDIT